ncbi:potassium/proton antiporter [Campylobacter sp. JMF_01 NE2]|uniref:potassium/proton antiporter n=1 Tax=unclassified Campylobacter TaxID=2593542 RepID=UPI0022E9BE24|nr:MULTISPECIES: potassium/proton antiporter [unclassified Campylobacter]MDA3042481.1 potassium/proton antiporter [Campylobacter sp. JMF_09 ED2]MDA3044705.1 potassium/proton antiporter [Campylobacter sp. JMF_07 ED4]MDA3052879.1 potassium/proton antiporter [Campylobacter sp. JMF_03 NE3]MDA3063173.1 potassium/proton antiporter [Campylobacter sp. JMF_11 EL3]MDA3067210.1 potassium/proton antiporter [Campylobacter sp. JMF_01 NE2]
MEILLSSLNLYIIGIGVILFISVYASKISEKIGLPLLLVFLGFGMLLGSEGIVGIEFDNPHLAQAVGTIALVFILYSGGLNTKFEHIKSVMVSGVLLATIGVLLTALIMAVFIHLVLGFAPLHALLLGSIISSTDAAAVFMILRSQKIKLKNGLNELLELESGSNDPMAIFLTIAILNLIVLAQDTTIEKMIMHFFLQFAVGGVLGIAFGYLFPRICINLRLMQTGLYPLISIAWLLIMFGLSSHLGGNGYLSVYMAGVLANKYAFPNKENIIAFHEVIAWMMQIVVFLTLGLLVFPSDLPQIAHNAIILSLVLIFIARPASVFISLIKSKYSKFEKFYISWVGLRGAVPIILATYPYVYHLEESHIIFNIVFFMVLISVLIQGTTINFAAKKLNITEKDGDDFVI